MFNTISAGLVYLQPEKLQQGNVDVEFVTFSFRVSPTIEVLRFVAPWLCLPRWFSILLVGVLPNEQAQLLDSSAI